MGERPTGALNVARDLIRKEISRREYSRAQCALNNQAVYVAHLTAQIRQLEGFDKDLGTLAAQQDGVREATIEECAKVAEMQCYSTTGRQIASRIREIASLEQETGRRDPGRRRFHAPRCETRSLRWRRARADRAYVLQGAQGSGVQGEAQEGPHFETLMFRILNWNLTRLRELRTS